MNRWVTGSIEHVGAVVTADVLLDDQTVALSIDKGVTWLPGVWVDAAWIDGPKFRRRCRTSAALTMPSPRTGEVLVKVTDLSETPIMEAGDYIIVPK